MQIYVTNRTATVKLIEGLGRVPANSTQRFVVNESMLRGRDNATGFHLKSVLDRYVASGDIYYELDAEVGDMGHFRKVIRASFAAGSFTAVALTQDFDAARPFPDGARFLGGRAVIVAALTSSDGDLATSVLDVGTTVDPDAFATNLDAMGATGEVRLDENGSGTAYVGLNLGGLTLRVNLTNTGAGANISTTTAGEFYVEFDYYLA